MSHPDDPFGGNNKAPPGNDRTMIMPRPGGRPAPGAAPASPQAQPAPAYTPPPGPAYTPPPAQAAPAYAQPAYAPASAPTAAPLRMERVSGANPLARAAGPLLALVGRLRATIAHASPAGLRAQLLAQLRDFEQEASGAGIAQEDVLLARYTLCTVLDEAVMGTPWGSASEWGRQSLLATLHNETWGGEKVFKLLEHCLQNPRGRLDLLELLYLCLCLGFEGRFRVLPDGRGQLEALRAQTYAALRGARGEFERELSPRWRGLVTGGGGLSRVLPPWLGLVLGAALLLALLLGFRLSLSGKTDPVLGQIAALGDIALAPLDAAPPAPVVRPKLADFLPEDIASGRVAVEDLDDRSIVTIKGDGLFASGSDEVAEAHLPLMGRIGKALEQVPGNVLVEGHTDNRPITSLRFPSNWALSEQRATHVVMLLATSSGNPQRYRIEGRGDSKPVASNDTAEGRARNRRVVVTLFAEGAQ
ncbi:MAG: DotU family type VI secretion system protein [Gammaproteobacteria bacterium]|nr:DotU family type VI secretion system protein [Gammaproteobacteria bacterium]